MTASADTSPTAVRAAGATAILPVRDLAASLDYYVGALGFRVDWRDPGIMAGVSRDAAHLMLCQGDQGQPGTWVWIGVNDAAALFAESTARGARVRTPPTNYPWALECHLFDPDGNVLRFGSEPLAGQPFGPWVDTGGQSWVRTPEGRWELAGA